MSKTKLPECRTVAPANDGGDEDILIADCEALLFCLDNGRFVVVRPAEPKDFWPVNGGWGKLRALVAGDAVVYKGDKTVVRAVEVYR